MAIVKQTVFIVDDDEAVRGALRLLMKSVGHEAKTFDSGDEFLASCSSGVSGCLILDIRMPGMSGLELQKNLQQQGVKIPIIFITGHGDVPMAVANSSGDQYDHRRYHPTGRSRYSSAQF